MIDLQVRELERRWRESRSSEHAKLWLQALERACDSTEREAVWLEARIATHDLDAQRVSLASYLNHPASLLIAEPWEPHAHDRFSEGVAAALRWGGLDTQLLLTWACEAAARAIDSLPRGSEHWLSIALAAGRAAAHGEPYPHPSRLAETERALSTGLPTAMEAGRRWLRGEPLCESGAEGERHAGHADDYCHFCVDAFTAIHSVIHVGRDLLRATTDPEHAHERVAEISWHCIDAATSTACLGARTQSEEEESPVHAAAEEAELASQTAHLIKLLLLSTTAR